MSILMILHIKYLLWRQCVWVFFNINLDFQSSLGRCDRLRSTDMNSPCEARMGVAPTVGKGCQTKCEADVYHLIKERELLAWVRAKANFYSMQISEG